MDNFVKIAEEGEINDGEAKLIEIEDKRITLFKVDGDYFATDDSCTHEDASISKGEIEGYVVTCPLHGSRFNVKTGAVLSLPAMFPLKTYRVKRDGNDIKVAVE